VVSEAGSLDVSFNAVGLPQPGIQGTPIAQLSLANFRAPVDTYAISHFLTTRAAARRMAPNGSGVILTLTAGPSRQAAPLVGGMAWSWAGIEALTRTLAAELGPSGVRVLGMCSDGLSETATIDVVYGLHADTIGVTVPEFQAAMNGMTHRKRAGTLAEVANLAAFLASDGAGGMTGTIVNMTGGSAPD